MHAYVTVFFYSNVRQGTIVEEQTPQRHKYTIHSPTTGSLANAADTSILISSDPYNTGAPSYPSDSKLKFANEERAPHH